MVPNAVINAYAVIRNKCNVTSGAVIDHDNRLKDFVHVSPNVTFAGTVKVGEGTYGGSGPTVILEKEIGKRSVVGAEAVVTKDVGCRRGRFRK